MKVIRALAKTVLFLLWATLLLVTATLVAAALRTSLDNRHQFWWVSMVAILGVTYSVKPLYHMHLSDRFCLALLACACLGAAAFLAFQSPVIVGGMKAQTFEACVLEQMKGRQLALLRYARAVCEAAGHDVAAPPTTSKDWSDLGEVVTPTKPPVSTGQ